MKTYLPFSLLVLLPFIGCSAPADDPGVSEGAVGACDVHPERSLVIVDRSVLDDATATAPGGAWNFSTVLGTLLDLNKDAGTLVTERFASPAVLHHWPLLADGKIDLTRAPFRLLAVVLRPEGSSTSLAELRLVYEGYESGSLGTFVSMEYQVDPASPPPFAPAAAPPVVSPAERAERRSLWIAAWRLLEEKPFGTPSYVAALSSLTEAVTRSKSLRTIAVERRDSSLGPASAFRFTALGKGGWRGLDSTAIADTPPADWNDRSFVWKSTGWDGCGWSGGRCSVEAPLRELIETGERDLYAGTFRLPKELAAHEIVGRPDSVWGTSFFPPEGWTTERWDRARRAFSRSTCDGCHGADTGTASVQHIISQGEQSAKLSPFLADQELPARMIAYRAVVCGRSSLPAAITALPAGGIEVGKTCSTLGSVVSEPCSDLAEAPTRYAVCVRDGAELKISERTECVQP